jgi:uncharacterized protein YcsI (UPF0317 family)
MPQYRGFDRAQAAHDAEEAPEYWEDDFESEDGEDINEE